jgi:Peptidase family M23
VHAADQLANWTRIVGNPTPTTKVGPAQSAVVWLDVALDKGFAVPAQLTHVIGVSIPQPQPPMFPATMNVNVAPIAVQTRKPVVISAPLAGPSWVDADSCCELGAHRAALNPVNGKLWGAERFAIDYLQLDPQGRLVTGDQTKLESYPFFGDDIHAVAAGTVVAAVDGLPEQIPGKNPTGLPLDQYAGNHVVQDLGDGNYALYAHLKTGSVKVKPGDRLTDGQIIGLLGNSGNSNEPHLHFHVMNSPDPLGSDGLPFVFSSFRLDARRSLGDPPGVLEGQPVPLEPGLTARDETDVSPLTRDVMTYADR